MPPLPPASATLDAEVLAWTRRHGIVVWLDREGCFSRFVDRLVARGGPVPVVAYRGSWLETMLAMEEHAGGSDRAPLLVHLPGHTEETIRATPALEIYRQGVRFRKALPTLITEAATGLVAPDAIRRFLEGDPSLEDADAWLAAEAVRLEGGLRAELQRFTLCALLDDLLGARTIERHLRDDLDHDVLWDHVHRVAGMGEAWRSFAGDPVVDDVKELGYLLGAWVLSVEYVHDLRRAPFVGALDTATQLPKPLVAACCEAAAWLRRARPDDYVRIADTCEGLLAEEAERGAPEDLGKIDTFRFEEARVLEAAIRLLDQDGWEPVLAWARDREADKSFWVSRDPERRTAWQLVGAAATLGAAIAGAGRALAGAVGLEDATARYVRQAAAVDRAHRHLEQRRTALLGSHLPHFGDLRDALDRLRDCWRTWANDLARDWTGVCRASGFLPTESLQQRHLFDQVVKPLCDEGDRVALFVVDALRFEMAEELVREIGGEPGTVVDLRPRLAELPSVTEVGMNALAPVARGGRIAPVLADGAFAGLKAAEFVVRDPETRRRMMHLRVGGTSCPLLPVSEVLGRSVESLRNAVHQARLVVIHGTEIDEGGETNLGPAVFDLALRDLRSAWRLLREAGVRRFVFTADHGFLLVDDGVKPRPFGRRVDPGRRHVFYPAPAEEPGLVTASLAQLGYEDAAGYVLFPEDTTVFDTGKRRQTFVHGGNSPQERVIPVLTVRHRTAAGGGDTRFAVRAEVRKGVAHMHCVGLTVLVASEQAALPFGGAHDVEVALRVPGRSDVTVELCDARDATIRGGAVRARVGQPAEVFFRLLGPREERVRVEVFSPTAAGDVEAAAPDGRYPVTAATAGEGTTRPAPEAAVVSWLEQLADEGVRRVFAHLERHGVITEEEATGMLGGPRAFRRFSAAFENFAARAPFRVRIEAAGTGKRYVRDGEV